MACCAFYFIAMKKLFTFLAVALLAVGCSKIFDTSVLERNIIELKDRVTALEEQCKQMNTNISSLQTIVTALQSNDYVTGVAPITQSGVEVGYTITFSKSGAITIYHGKDGSDGLNGSDGNNGSDGASGSTPIVGVKQDTDGVYYWTLNGEWLLNDKGEKVKAISTDGKDGEDGTDGANGKDGKDGVTPQLKIENGYWYVSYNNGESWESLGKATGENGSDGAAGKEGDSFFQSVTQDENNVIFTLADGTVLTIPKSSSYLFNKLQSVSYVPRYSDGKATVYYSSTANSQLELDFEVSPKDAVAQIAAQWQEILTVKAINTQTRAVTYIDMPILGCTADTQHGVITVTASGSNLAANFYTGEQTVSARLGISDGNTNITSEYIQLAAAPATEPFANEIWYTSTDGNIVEPYKTDVFGANIVSNTYENGRGVILFDSNINAIGDYAFQGCHTLQTITLPNSIKAIRTFAFGNCGLTNLTIPDSVVTIAEDFISSGNTALTSFDGKFVTTDKRAVIVDNILLAYANGCDATEYAIPDGVTRIGTGAFAYNRNLSSVTIPYGVTEIGDNAFVCCDNLASIVIPNSVAEIGSYAFSYCIKLADMTIPDNVNRIGGSAFTSCRSLTNITIPSSVTIIGEGAFAYCENLTEFKGKFASADGKYLIIDGVLECFATGCGVTEYTIPSGITTIGYSAFAGCKSLQSVTIPDGVTSIRFNAFDNCTNLKYVTISDSVSEVMSGAFSHCAIDTFYGKYGTESKCYVLNDVLHCFATGCGATEYAIHDGITTIAPYAFSNCDTLISVTIPNSVTTICPYSFYSCDNLTSVYCAAVTPPTATKNFSTTNGGMSFGDWDAFWNNATNRKIYVPRESVDAYKAADGWKLYADAIEGYDF